MRKTVKTLVSIVAIVALLGSFTGCSLNITKPSEGLEAKDNKTLVRVTALKGPTGMGMVKLMENNKNGTALNNYEIELAGAPDEIVGQLTSGSVDIAAVPTNLASVLYNKTKGNIQMVAINTLGVLYILERGETIQAVEDLKGKTLKNVGQGSTPEFAINYILEQNGIVPGKDITIDYLSEHSQTAALLTSKKIDLAVVPEPFVTSILMKNDDIRIALDITKEWKDISKNAGDQATELAMGCIVVRKAFAEENKQALNDFLKEYEESTSYVNENVDEASKLVAENGIIAEAALAKKAIPNCNIVYIDGDEMKRNIIPYFNVLFKADPKSIGGKMPDEDFYYKK